MGLSMADGIDLPGGEPARAGRHVRFSEALGVAICARLAAGEGLAEVLRDPGMPVQTTVANWARAYPEFGEALRAARRQARLAQRTADLAALALRARARAHERRGRASTYTPKIAAAICERLANGETLTSIARDPAMPSFATVLNWVRHRPDFADAYAQARQVFADHMCDEARDLGQVSTHETVWSDRLQFDTIRWAAARAAPKKYCERLVVEGERAAAQEALGDAPSKLLK